MLQFVFSLCWLDFLLLLLKTSVKHLLPVVQYETWNYETLYRVSTWLKVVVGYVVKKSKKFFLGVFWSFLGVFWPFLQQVSINKNLKMPKKILKFFLIWGALDPKPRNLPPIGSDVVTLHKGVPRVKKFGDTNNWWSHSRENLFGNDRKNALHFRSLGPWSLGKKFNSTLPIFAILL